MLENPLDRDSILLYASTRLFRLKPSGRGVDTPEKYNTSKGKPSGASATVKGTCPRWSDINVDNQQGIFRILGPPGPASRSDVQLFVPPFASRTASRSVPLVGEALDRSSWSKLGTPRAPFGVKDGRTPCCSCAGAPSGKALKASTRPKDWRLASRDKRKMGARRRRQAQMALNEGRRCCRSTDFRPLSLEAPPSLRLWRSQAVPAGTHNWRTRGLPKVGKRNLKTLND